MLKTSNGVTGLLTSCFYAALDAALTLYILGLLVLLLKWPIVLYSPHLNNFSDQGQVAECGSHSELMAKRGLYHSLWNRTLTGTVS